MRTIYAALAAATVALAPNSHAQDPDPYGFQARGFIHNAVSAKCWFVQTYQRTNPHFMSASMKHTTNHNL